jgi:superfamily II DNA or RNA helicase
MRPYQARLVGDVHAAWASGARAVCMQLGTGGGKTHTAAQILREETGPVVFAAHLDSLVGDTAARLGVPCGIVAPWAPPTPGERIQVCSLGTLHARGTRPPAGLVVLDECHRSEAPTVKAILADYPAARILGLTATPQRGDGAPLGDTFDAMVCGPSVRELTAMGELVPAHMVVPCDEGGRGDAVAELRRLRGAWRALVFCESRAEAAYTVERLTDAGHPAGYIDGETPRAERERLRVALRARELHALVGVSVFVEGFDEPSVDVVALDAPFGTLGRYLQAIGRGLRAHPGKTHCTVLDVRGAVFLHLPPDVEHEWSLSGEAVTQRLAGLAFARCAACWAVFPKAKVCPRCGVSALVRALPVRRLQRAARMAALESMPAEARRARYHASLVHVGVSRRRMSPERARRWADEECAKRWP